MDRGVPVKRPVVRNCLRVAVSRTREPLERLRSEMSITKQSPPARGAFLFV